MLSLVLRRRSPRPHWASGRSIGTQLEGSFTWTPIRDRLAVETDRAAMGAQSCAREAGGIESSSGESLVATIGPARAAPDTSGANAADAGAFGARKSPGVTMQ